MRKVNNPELFRNKINDKIKIHLEKNGITGNIIKLANAVIGLFRGNENNTRFAWCIFGVYPICNLLLSDLCKLCTKGYKWVLIVLVFFYFLVVVWRCCGFTILYKKFIL